MAAHLRGYRLLREAGVDDFRITALCSLPEDEARMYVRRGEGPPQRPAVSHFADDPLAVADEYLSDFQDDVEVQVYSDFRRMIAEAPITAVNDFTNQAMHHQVAEAALEAGKDLLTEKPMAVTLRAARRMCELAEARGLVLGVFQSGRLARAPATCDGCSTAAGSAGCRWCSWAAWPRAGPRTASWPTRPGVIAAMRGGRNRAGRRRAPLRHDPLPGRRDPRHPGPHRHRRAGARGATTRRAT